MRHEVELVRDLFAGPRTFGRLFFDGLYLGETLEDEDLRLEDGGVKVYGRTAIPRGRYRLSITFSNRFGKPMPQIHDVPQYTGVRIHGGNTVDDTLGCPLLGRRRTADGVGIADCAGPNARLMQLLEAAEDAGEECWITVR